MFPIDIHPIPPTVVPECRCEFVQWWLAGHKQYFPATPDAVVAMTALEGACIKKETEDTCDEETVSADSCLLEDYPMTEEKSIKEEPN